MSVHVGEARHAVSIRVPGLGSKFSVADQYELGQHNSYFTTVQCYGTSDPAWTLKQIRDWAQSIVDEAERGLQKAEKRVQQ